MMRSERTSSRRKQSLSRETRWDAKMLVAADKTMTKWTKTV